MKKILFILFCGIILFSLYGEENNNFDGYTEELLFDKPVTAEDLVYNILTFKEAARSSGKTVSITYYSGSKGIFKLEPPGGEVKWALHLKGTTSLKVLWFQIQKNGSSKKHDIKLFFDESSDFDAAYIFKEGKGYYSITIFGASTVNAPRYTGLCTFTVKSTEDLPSKKFDLFLNSEMLKYVDTKIGKKVGRGECWDLAQDGLDFLNADWQRTTDFGFKLDPEKEDIFPGDIIQFKSVKVEYYYSDGSISWETLGNPNHTAIVYRVLGKNIYELAHQNISGKRYVVITSIDLNKMTRGRYSIYRPLLGLLKKEYSHLKN